MFDATINVVLLAMVFLFVPMNAARVESNQDVPVGNWLIPAVAAAILVQRFWL